jgi:p-methyltransferase
MSRPLDCLILGYDDDTPQQFARLAAGDPDSVEHRTFQRNQVMVDGVPMTYLDALNHALGATPAWAMRDAAPFYHVGEVTNLAALYLASYLETRGVSARPIGLVSAEGDAIDAALADERPRVVAITTTFYEDTQVVARLVARIRARHADAIVVVGGPLVQNLNADLAPEAFAQGLGSMGADVYVLEREGEASLLALTMAVRDGGDLARVPNLYVRDGARFVFTGAAREQNDLDACAIAWDRVPDALLGRTVQTRTARSCAYHCAFCDYPIRAGKLSVSSVEVVERELEALQRRGVENVVFIDDTFNVPEERFRAICEMMIRRDFGFRWFSYFRCGSVRRADTFTLMRRSGCAGVFLGIESGDATVLRNMDKASTVEQYRRGIAALHAEGILTFASFICGFPGETAETVANTIAFIRETKPTLYRVEPWWYNHRSPIHARAAEFGLTGHAYDWAHATMTAREACDAIDRIFQGVTDSHWCPQQSFSFWALPYLLGKGMSRDQVEAFHRLMHARLLRVTGRAADAADATGREPDEALLAFAATLQLEAPRFVRPRAEAAQSIG